MGPALNKLDEKLSNGTFICVIRNNLRSFLRAKVSRKLRKFLSAPPIEEDSPGSRQVSQSDFPFEDVSIKLFIHQELSPAVIVVRQLKLRVR